MKLALAAAAALIATPAIAADAVCSFQSAHGDTATVSYADLDLRYERDRGYLAARVERAVDRVCGVDPYERQFAVQRVSERCVTETTPAADAALQAVLAQYS